VFFLVFFIISQDVHVYNNDDSLKHTNNTFLFYNIIVSLDVAETHPLVHLTGINILLTSAIVALKQDEFWKK
jgi:hypothetical protein